MVFCNKMQPLFSWIKTHERHLSAIAMIAGFVVDNLFFGRVDDLWQTHIVFLIYSTICFVSIPLTQWLELRAGVSVMFARLRTLVPFATQFALGGFWSGFVIFYGRSADVGASWPFLLFLILIFLGSEYFSQYHTRLVFTSILFFFALYSYAIFALPVLTHSIGTSTFIASGVVAIIIFALFTVLLRLLVKERFFADIWRIRVGAVSVLVIMNVFYFANILPPLPLAAKAAGVYHAVWRVPGAYFATRETDQPWQVRYLGFVPTLHVIKGELVFAHSSVFAPTALKTEIVHVWEWYDEIRKQWVQKARITYPIVGGRDGGYGGYSNVTMNQEGKWRVSVETPDGRRVVRMPFHVEYVNAKPQLTTVTLK